MTPPPTISPLEYHVLLSIATAPKYGYAIKEAIEAESGGTIVPSPGSLYRVIARLMTRGWVSETELEEVAPHPGLPRRYYMLTNEGRTALAGETDRLRAVANLAHERLEAPEGRA